MYIQKLTGKVNSVPIYLLNKMIIAEKIINCYYEEEQRSHL